MSCDIPLKNATDVLIIEVTGDDQVKEEEESTPTITEEDQACSQYFKQSEDFTQQGPINLH